ncbi:MAG: prolipoprotein diacylglyceryl transferase [Lachnospiraceae bacterium]|nr:prolipoprotein diacylglyceryl transferase [Lachnospiraceae bacterium]
MKIDIFSIGPLTIHGYGLMIGIGIVFCILLGTKRAKKRGMSEDAVVDIAIWGVLIGFLGAKLLYILVEFDRFLVNPRAVLGSEGFVVYGGIIAGVFAAIVYCRIKKLRFLSYFDLVVPSIALAQGFGRIGCFLAGCCYGRPTHSFLGVTFPQHSLAPAGVKLLPTQLFSSLGDFVIMGILLWYAKRAKQEGDVAILYMILYSVGRFGIEFLRNDDRGGFLIFTTSQWISIGIVLFAVLLRYFLHRQPAKAPAGNVS